MGLVPWERGPEIMLFTDQCGVNGLCQQLPETATLISSPWLKHTSPQGQCGALRGGGDPIPSSGTCYA